MKIIRDYIREKAVLVGLLAFIIILGWAMCGTGCATAPRTPAEIHAEGQQYGENIRDWPGELQEEFARAHRAYVSG